MSSLSPMPQDTTRQFEMLVKISRLLSTLDLDQVLTTIIRLTTDTVGAAQGSFFLIDEAGDKLQRFISAREIAPENKAAVSSTILKGGLASWVIANQRSALVEDTATDSRWIKLDDEAEMKRVRSAICVPFLIENRIRGVMTLEHPEPNHFGDGDLALVEAAANQAATMLRHAQLFDRVESQQRQLEAVLNSISEMLIVVDGEWRVRMLNPEALAFIGAPATSLVDRSLESLAETGHAMFGRLYSQLVETPEIDGSVRFELRDERSRRDFTVHAAPLDRTDPRQTGYVIALHDISSLKDLNRLKNHMIELATHDLKNPIGVVKGYLDVIKADAEEGLSPDTTFLDNMYKAILRMESLVANLLDIQRAEHASPLRREWIQPQQLVDQVLEDMQPTLLRMGHTLVRDMMNDMKPISGDHDRLREVMNNLVENAIKYTPENGQITVKVYTEGNRFSFSVSDTGYGIPEDKKNFIFQPNFRVLQQGTEHIPGSGVGLSLVREMVERHGGQVWFTSKQGQGSTFGFWLPLLNE